MTDKLILKKAIEKAVKNGWKNKVAIAFISTNNELEIISREYYGTIFSHGFAEAFVRYIQKEKPKMFLDLLGDYKRGKQIENKTFKEIQEAWEIGIAMRNFLQQMVLEKNPLKYIEKFID